MASQQLEEIMKKLNVVTKKQVKLQKVTNKKSWWNCQH